MNRSTRKTLEKNSVLKAYLQKIKKLVVDERGEMSYIENFDRVIEDIFGVKNFAKRLNQCYDDRDTIVVLNSLGSKILNEMLMIPSLYQAFAELVAVDARILEIKKKIRRAEKKGKKKDKDLLKEYEYLTELYKKAKKKIRQRFGIASKKKAYKSRYSALLNIVDGYYEDDDEISSLLYSSDLEFDDDDELSELEDYERYLSGGKSGKGRRIARLMNYDMDEDDDDFDELDDDDADEASNNRLSKIESIVSNLANTVQYMMNTGMKQDNVGYRPYSHAPQYTAPIVNDDGVRPRIKNTTAGNQELDSIYSTINKLSKTQEILVESNLRLSNSVARIENYLANLDVVDEDDEPDYNDMSIQAQVDDDISPAVTARSPRPARSPKREELIEQINRSAAPAQVDNTETAESTDTNATTDTNPNQDTQ